MEESPTIICQWQAEEWGERTRNFGVSVQDSVGVQRSWVASMKVKKSMISFRCSFFFSVDIQLEMEVKLDKLSIINHILAF